MKHSTLINFHHSSSFLSVIWTACETGKAVSLRMHRFCKTSAIVLGLFSSAVCATAATWDAGETPVTDWITLSYTNWSDDASPVGKDVVFNSTGWTGIASTVTNTVNDDVSVKSLTYSYNSGSNWHVTDIAAGKTLTVGGTSAVFTVGGDFSSTQTVTNTVIKGAGSLVISEDGGKVFIGNNRNSAIDNPHSKAVLDMHELSSFSANLGTTGIFSIGSSAAATPSTQSSEAIVRLAAANSIVAKDLLVGSIASGHDNNANIDRPTQDPTILYLGATNTINVNNILIGSGGTTGLLHGKMLFDAADSSVVIRAANGTDRVSLFYVGVKGIGTTGGGIEGVADFSGGEVDIKADTMIVGQGAGKNPNLTAGTFIMEKGTVDTNSLVLGKGYNITTGVSTTGTLTVNGGSFLAGSIVSGLVSDGAGTVGSVNGVINVKNDGVLETGTLTMAQSTVNSATNVGAVTSVLNIANSAAVEVSGAGIVMGQRAGGSDKAALTATINLDGGSLTVNGHIAEASSDAVTAINLNGGHLDMKSYNISVDTFTAKSGQLSNVGQLNSGGDLVKTTAGTLILSGSNTYTGETKVNGGTLLVNGNNSGASGDVTVGTGALLGGKGTVGGATTLAVGAFLSAGDSSLSTFTIGNTLDISAVNDIGNLVFTLGAVGSSDKIVSNGLTIGMGTLGFNDFAFSVDTGFGAGTYTLFESTGITGSLDIANLTGIIGGENAALAISGNNIVLTVIPEPSTIIFTMLGGLFLLATCRATRKA